MSDLSIVPTGFTQAIKEYTLESGAVPKEPISFISSPSFEFYRDPSTGEIESMSGLGLLASKVLYNLFSPIGSYALDTTQGSFLEDILGDSIDKATLTVELIRSVQKAEDKLKASTSSTIKAKNLDESLDSIRVIGIDFIEEDSVNIRLAIKAQSGKSASLRLEV